MIWILVCIVPLLIPFFLKYKNPNYSWKELLICCCASVLLSVGIICLSTYYGMIDTQILSGRVTDKIKESVSCEHSYSCNCIRTCNGKSCSTHCSTCYEHSNDYDYNIHSTIGTFTCLVSPNFFNNSDNISSYDDLSGIVTPSTIVRLIL